MHFVSLHSVLRSLVFHCFLGGGGSCRRQGKSAAPDGPAWWRWLVGSWCLVTPSNRLSEERGEGAGSTKSQPPPPPGPAFARGLERNGGSGGWGPGGGPWRGVVFCERLRVPGMAE